MEAQREVPLSDFLSFGMSNGGKGERQDSVFPIPFSTRRGKGERKGGKERGFFLGEDEGGKKVMTVSK